MGDWKYLPSLVLQDIYKYLGRRDRLSCTLVCSEWKSAMDYVRLWQKMVIYIDEDFLEPSTIFLTRDYHVYLQTLEIGWAHPMTNQSKWSFIKYKDLTKRVGRFLIILFEKFVQLHHLKIFEWYDIFHLRKLSYLLLRLIKYQCNLQTVSLCNANLYEMDFSNILVSCLRSKSSTTNLDLHYSSYHVRKQFDGWIFTSCMEQFGCLVELSLDYWIFWHYLNKVQVRNSSLKRMEICLEECDKRFEALPDISLSKWRRLKWIFPSSSVKFLIHRVLSFDQLDVLLKPNIPLTAFSWHPLYDFRNESCDKYNRILMLLADRFRDTIENINLDIYNMEQDSLKNEIKYVGDKCTKMKSLSFNHVTWIEN